MFWHAPVQKKKKRPQFLVIVHYPNVIAESKYPIGNYVLFFNAYK